MEHLKYHVEVFWSEEDGGYIANVPDLKYCSAFGETYDEALREVRVAVDLHLDVLKKMGRTSPEPTVASELRPEAEAPDTCDRLTRIGPRRTGVPRSGAQGSGPTTLLPQQEVSLIMKATVAAISSSSMLWGRAARRSACRASGRAGHRGSSPRPARRCHRRSPPGSSRRWRRPRSGTRHRTRARPARGCPARRSHARAGRSLPWCTRDTRAGG